MYDYNKRSSGFADYTNNANERVTYNLSKAESLLDEPDGAFRFGGDPFGRPQTGGNYPPQNRIGVAGGKSNYTGSDMGDSD